MKRRKTTTTLLVPLALIALALAGCGGSSTTPTRSSTGSSENSPSPSGNSSSPPPPSQPSPPSPTPVVITTTSLPTGTVGNAYAATLAASGGTSPYKWKLTSGSLPSGLSLDAATGAITGTPTVTARQLSLTFQVTDSSASAQTTSVTLPLTISAGTIAIS